MPSTASLLLTGLLTGLLTLALLLLTSCLFWLLYSLYRNIQGAKSTALPYKVVPIYHYDFLTSLLFNSTILKVLNKILPKPAITSWRKLVVGSWPLKARHAVFKAFKTDNFLLVTPGGTIFTTADPPVIAQILSRDAQFPKAIAIYKSIRIYGENGMWLLLFSIFKDV